jgi:hypothetical protein
MDNPEQLKVDGTDQLCSAYGHSIIGSSVAIKTELLRRGAISEVGIQQLQNGAVRMGMDRCSVIVLLGMPTITNDTGNIEVLVFGQTTFVTFTDGRVTGILAPD